eukprot:s6537_g1.t1
MRELNESNTVEPGSSGAGGEAGEHSSPVGAIDGEEQSSPVGAIDVEDDVYDHASDNNDEANYESAEDAIRAIDLEEPCTSGVSEQKCDRAAQLGLRLRGKQGRGRGGRGRGRGHNTAAGAEYTAAQWAEWEEWDRLENEWNAAEHAAEDQPIVEKSKPKKKNNKAEAADEEPIVEKSKEKKKKNKAEAADEEQIVEKSKEKKKNKAEAADEEPIVEKSKEKKKNKAEAADEEPIVEKPKKKKNKAEAIYEVAEPTTKRRRGGNNDGEKASFAGRYRPGVRPFESARWDAIKEAFDTQIKPKTTTPSMYEACFCWGLVYLDPSGPFWTWCMKDLKDPDVTVENVSQLVAKSTKRYLKLCLAM